jgi:acyl-CoA synthetase (AMP-forming)/AMP-acid ligase II
MLSLGVEKRTLVGFYLTNSPQFVFAWLGTWGIGCAPAMINHHLSGEALIHCVRLSATKILLVDSDEECIARIEAVRSQLERELGIRIVILDAATEAKINSLEPKRPDDEYRKGMLPTFPMALIYTRCVDAKGHAAQSRLSSHSGSTGFPKAVPFSVGRSIPFAGRKTSNIGIKCGPNGDRYYNCMPMYHGTGGTVAVNCMLSGITLCIGKKFSATKFWDDIKDSDATAFVYVGEAARYLLSQPPSPYDRDNKVRVMFGNGLRPDVWKKFQDRFGIDTVAEFFNSSEGVFGTINVCRGALRMVCCYFSDIDIENRAIYAKGCWPSWCDTTNLVPKLLCYGGGGSRHWRPRERSQIRLWQENSIRKGRRSNCSSSRCVYFPWVRRSLYSVLQSVLTER